MNLLFDRFVVITNMEDLIDYLIYVLFGGYPEFYDLL